MLTTVNCEGCKLNRDRLNDNDTVYTPQVKSETCTKFLGRVVPLFLPHCLKTSSCSIVWVVDPQIRIDLKSQPFYLEIKLALAFHSQLSWRETLTLNPFYPSNFLFLASEATVICLLSAFHTHIWGKINGLWQVPVPLERIVFAHYLQGLWESFSLPSISSDSSFWLL